METKKFDNESQKPVEQFKADIFDWIVKSGARIESISYTDSHCEVSYSFGGASPQIARRRQK